MTATASTREAGRARHIDGQLAESSVARHYAGQGHAVAARRWRSPSGEIDLVVRTPDEIVFVEVKKAATCAAAAFRLGARQIERLCAAATDFLAGEPAGLGTAMRFDLALVDRFGRVEVIENAFGAA
ncbi:MAG: YraN family protein [Rhodobacteraceae bacterium]|nr:YraN family protein [Paracoccaceae bacterium]